MDTTTATAGTLIAPLLTELEGVMAAVTPDQYGLPTPCAEFDVARLRQHILGWVTYFGVALNDPEGTSERPAPESFEAPADPQDAAAVVAAAAHQIKIAVDAGIEQRPVHFVQATMPGQGVLTMALLEYLVHGHDLAAATGQPWQPADDAAAVALPFAQSTLSDDFRGPEKSFAAIVPVPDDAPALDRLLGFSGRDPHWAPATT